MSFFKNTVHNSIATSLKMYLEYFYSVKCLYHKIYSSLIWMVLNLSTFEDPIFKTVIQMVHCHKYF